MLLRTFRSEVSLLAARLLHAAFSKIPPLVTPEGRKKAFCATKVGSAASVESVWSVAACLPAT